MIKNLIDNKVNEIQDELILHLKKFVKIYSIESKQEENAPFGEGPKEALEYILNLSKN